MIGKENIEEKIFEYFEGELNSTESKELEDFIQNNPEYQVDFQAWKNSNIESEAMEYKFADELLVNEKKSPKVWFKWVSSGAFLFLISFASASLINNYQGGKEKVANLQSFDDEILATDPLESANILDSKNGGGSSDKNSEGISVNNLLINATPSNVLKKSSNIRLFDEDKSKNAAFEIEIKSSSKTVKNSKNVLNKNLEIETENISNKKGSSLHVIIHINALKDGKYIFDLPSNLTKARYNYENPNKSRLFVTNNKDPYLNYALAQTLEENGSFAGNHNNGEGIRAEMLYRTEWPSVTQDNFSSTIFSLDSRVDKLKGGLGLIVNADRIGHGKLNSTAASLIYSPKFLVKTLSIEPSFKYTFNQKSISWNQVDENDVKDPRNGVLYASIPYAPENVIKTNLIHHDLGLGLLINADKFYLGAQIDHLNQPTYFADFFDQKIIIPSKISAMVGTDILKAKDGKTTFSPSLNYIKFGNYNALWINSKFSFQGFFFAGGFATNEELMASLGYGNNKVRVVYGLGFSKPSEFSGLEVSNQYHESHQLSLRVNLQPKR